MSRLRVDPSRVREIVLVREDRVCPVCGARMHVRCSRTRNIQTLSGPVRLIVKLVQCPNEQCDSTRTFASEQEAEYAMPRWGIGWDVFCWIGHRRFARHWSVSQIRHELVDSYGVALSDDAIEDHVASYQNMVAARHQDLREMVLDYCSVVRGILNDNHGGPYHPAGMRMLEALGDVQESLGRVASSGKSGPAFNLLGRLKGFIDRGVADQQDSFTRVREYTDQVRRVMDLLTDADGPPLAKRESQFAAKIEAFQCLTDDIVYAHFAKVMTSFRPGLFADADRTSHPRDNLDLERWFRQPKSHERRIHGHCHAGVRIVRDGPTLIPTLDAHASLPGVFTREDLFPFRMASPPPSQLASQQRHGIMRKSRSKKNESSC